MIEFTAILTILAMFLVRIGIPLVLLIVLGTLIERHQRQREEHIDAMYQKVTPFNKPAREDQHDPRSHAA